MPKRLPLVMEESLTGPLSPKNNLRQRWQEKEMDKEEEKEMLETETKTHQMRQDGK